MEKQLLALGYEHYANYIKLPNSILTEFANTENNFKKSKKKKKGIDLKIETNVNSDLKILPPYYFMIESSQGIISYCGVLDFTSDEGIVLIPNFILNQMGINGSDFIKIKYIGNIPKCSFITLEPQDKFIFEIPDLDKFLENILSNYCLLYEQFVVEFKYFDQNARILIKKIIANVEEEIQNEKFPVVDIVNTDIKIEIFNRFYEEEMKMKEKMKKIEETTHKQIIQPEQNSSNDNFKALGEGNKLGGINIMDPEIIREIRIQKLMQNSQSKKNSDPVDKVLLVEPIPKNDLLTTNKKNIKPKEFDV